jgi:hypothetical protein
MAHSGDRAGAVAMLEHAISLGRVNLGEDHPDVLAAGLDLARVYAAGDDPSAARRALEEAYAAGQWRLGDADPLMLEISYELGVVAEELGNRHEARKAFGRVAELGPAVLGEFHWTVTRAQQYLAGQTSAVRPPPAPVGHAAPEPYSPRFITPQAVDRAREGAPPTPEPGRARQAMPPAPEAGEPQAGVAPHAMPPARETPPLQQPVPPVRVDEQADPVQGPPPLVRRVPGENTPPVHHATPAWEQPPPLDRRARLGDEPTVLQPVVQARTGLPAHQPPPPLWPVPEEPPISPPPVRDAPAYPRRGPVLFAAVAAALAAVIAVVALVFVLADRRGDDPGQDTDVPTLGGGPPPADVRIRDFGSRIQVTWSDPGEGKTSFIVTGGHPGEVLRPMGEVGPGVTRYDLQGLNDQLDYCFAVVAVYGTDRFASSPQTCTSRVPGPKASD